MIDHIAKHIRSLRLAGRERGGVALIMLIGFIGLAVPITIASIQTGGQLSRSSRVYDSRLTAAYDAGAGIEVALHEIMTDPNFDAGLSPGAPDKQITVDTNGETVNVTVTKIFSSASMQGQAVVLDKTVMPTTAPVNSTTTFAYTITVKNEGSDAVTLEQIIDYLPPKLKYDPGTTDGLTQDEPSATNTFPPGDYIDPSCGEYGYRLTWDLSPYLQVAPGETLTLTFDATGALPDGTYYNQVRTRYDPWWVSPDVYIWTPYTAEVTVGTGDPKCGFDMDGVLVTKTVDPVDAVPGVETEFEYTISIENVSTSTRQVCDIEDLLPPTYTYVAGSSGDYPSNIETSEPSLSWQSASERWKVTWNNGGEDEHPPLISLASGEIKTQMFRALATPETGLNYFNEVNVIWQVYQSDDECEYDDLYTAEGGGTGQGRREFLTGDDAKVVPHG